MRHNLWGRIWLAVLAAGVVYPATALGFKRTMTCTNSGIYACDDGEDPKPVHWSARCVRYRVSDSGSANFDGSTDKMDDIEEIRRAIALSFGAWTEVKCSNMTLVDGGLTNSNNATYDRDADRNMNLVVWHDDDWDKVASARAFALTSVTFNPDNGVIVDADIEINSEYYKYSASTKPQANHVDLQNTLTHEAGHFVGLDHSKERAATMFSTAPIGEVAKRSLDPDDIAGICAAYPTKGASQLACSSAADFPSDEDLQIDNGVCSIAGLTHDAPARWALGLLGLVALALARRRRTPSA